MLTRQSVDPLVLLILCGLSFAWFGCASGETIPPPGGPPDKTPPQILETDPANGTLNFSGNRVSITFNEGLNPNFTSTQLSEQIIITPVPASPPNFSIGSKSIDIRFQDDLPANRTFAITIGPGITDRAGNRLGTPSTIRFSTGAVLDSGRISGQVLGVNQRTTYILAWQITGDPKQFGDTLNPDTTPPDFIAPIADAGTFSLEGLPAGRFRLMAIAEEFPDRTYTAGQDALGVAAEDVEIEEGESTGGIRIRLQPAPNDLTGPRLLTVRALNEGVAQLLFSEPVDTATLRPANITLTSSGRTIPILGFWSSPQNRSTTFISYEGTGSTAEGRIDVQNLTDTVGNRLDDTARTATFTFSTRVDTSAPTFIPPATLQKGIRVNNTLFLHFDEPVDLVGNGENLEEPIVRLSDSTSGKEMGYRVVRSGPALYLALPIDTTFRSAQSQLSIDLSQFADRRGNRTDTTWRQTVQVRPLPQRGSLEGSLIDSLAPNVPHVILLESTEDSWTYRIRIPRAGPWSIKEIPSGQYRLTAFRDADNNGEYSYGSINPYVPGEVFTEYSGGIRVRPRWTTTEVDIEF